MKKQPKKITSVSIKMTFTYTTMLCLMIIRDKKSTKQAIDEAAQELLRYAGELDRIENLTSIKKTTLKNSDNLKYKNYSITPKN
jgi:hypothetical protein